MAKNSMVQRELKRTKLVAKYAEKRQSLKAIIKSTTTSFEEKNGCGRPVAEIAKRLFFITPA